MNLFSRPSVFLENELTFCAVLAFWADLASKGYASLERYVEKSKIPEILKMYRYDGANKDEIFELIKWKYVSSNGGNPRLLFDDLKQLEYETKIEAPHFMQLNYLLSSYIQSIYVYYVDYDGFAVNTSGKRINTYIRTKVRFRKNNKNKLISSLFTSIHLLKWNV